ncbi:DUF1795 domain-containing protein [Actinotalea sp. C106]|uniref:DUF1795 domain-containing protein n=1 Tax=Actinotalea sp. C106 TaxID=2908644 RepID=UPI0020287197|nr:DUF1795 domain-containing protein [Actinotalea sp. C106]
MTHPPEAPAAPGWTRREAADGRLSLEVPPGWEVVEAPSPGVALVVVEPQDGTEFRSNLVLTVGELPPTMTFRDWQAGNDELLGSSLQEYLLVDLEHTEVGGLPAVRRLAHHTAPPDLPVTLQQWAVLVDGQGVTLSATTTDLGFGRLAPVFERVGGSLSLEGAWAR